MKDFFDPETGVQHTLFPESWMTPPADLKPGCKIQVYSYPDRWTTSIVTEVRPGQTLAHFYRNGERVESATQIPGMVFARAESLPPSWSSSCYMLSEENILWRR